MKNIKIKTVTPLSLVVFLVTLGISMESQANGDKDLFLSNNYGEMLALNSGVRGKPPHNRTKMNRQRKITQQSVEMSALEINRDMSISPPSAGAGKKVRGGHPYRKVRGGHPYHKNRHSNGY